MTKFSKKYKKLRFSGVNLTKSICCCCFFSRTHTVILKSQRYFWTQRNNAMVFGTVIIKFSSRRLQFCGMNNNGESMAKLGLGLWQLLELDKWKRSIHSMMTWYECSFFQINWETLELLWSFCCCFRLSQLSKRIIRNLLIRIVNFYYWFFAFKYGFQCTENKTDSS